MNSPATIGAAQEAAQSDRSGDIVITTCESHIHLVDDDAAIRDALSLSLEQAGYRVRAYASGQEFLDATLPAGNQCLLLDLCMPETGGLTVQAELIRRRISMPIVFMTDYGTVRDSVTAMKNGAMDFIEKPFSRALLLEKIKAAIDRDQRLRCSENILADVAFRQAEAHSRYDRLSSREKEVMSLVTSGKTSKQAGKALGISSRTVDVHRAHVMVKMHVSSLAELGVLQSLCADGVQLVAQPKSSLHASRGPKELGEDQMHIYRYLLSAGKVAIAPLPKKL